MRDSLDSTRIHPVQYEVLNGLRFKYLKKGAVSESLKSALGAGALPLWRTIRFNNLEIDGVEP
jgi:hypothetical protein